MSNHLENGTNNGSNSSESSKYFDLKHLPQLLKPLDRNQKVYDNILQVISNTPIVRLNSIPEKEGIQCEMYAKCEYFNPGGSVKDRIAYRMVLEAEKAKILIPGKSTIVEPTSGNTGIGLALAAAIKGYRCIIVLPDKMSDEKVNTLLSLGAEVRRTPTEVAWNDPQSNLSVARQIVKDMPGAVMLDQYDNPYNPKAHYDQTAEEILWSFDDKIDMVVIGAGTSGTVSGVGHKIKERCPSCVVVGVDPYGSILAVPEKNNISDVTFYEVEGIGYDFLPKVLDRSVVDQWMKTEDQSSLLMSKRLIREEGLLCGGSAGAAMSAAVRAAKSLKAGQRCVVLLPDGMRNYMTKFVFDQWMEARHFQDVVPNDAKWWNKPVPADIGEPVYTITMNTKPAEALTNLKKAGAPLLSVITESGNLIGIFTADMTRRKMVYMKRELTDDLSNFIVKKFYTVDLKKNPTLGLVSRILDIAPFVVLVNEDHATKTRTPLRTITANDLLVYTTSQKDHDDY